MLILFQKFRNFIDVHHNLIFTPLSRSICLCFQLTKANRPKMTQLVVHLFEFLGFLQLFQSLNIVVFWLFRIKLNILWSCWYEKGTLQWKWSKNLIIFGMFSVECLSYRKSCFGFRLIYYQKWNIYWCHRPSKVVLEPIFYYFCKNSPQMGKSDPFWSLFL